MRDPFTRLGSTLVTPTVRQAGFGVWLSGRTLALLPHLWRRRRSLLDQMYLAGVKSVHVVAFVAFFIGMIVALQIGLKLAEYGQQDSIGMLVAISMAREMAPFVTAVVLAASVASAMAAELGTMKVQDELTALEVMSIDAVSYLVLPRVLAMTLMAPILTAVADVVGIVGGGVIAVTQLQLDFPAYLLSVDEALRDPGLLGLPQDLYAGLIKSVVFGFMIAVVGCGSGMMAEKGAAGVARTTREAVRTSIILIIIFNYFLSWLLVA
ncbi:MAG: ABC transporter permease [Planctomycetota bacterium]|nr:MAG: ABC transporter permease [Planctomycetota bacterium]